MDELWKTRIEGLMKERGLDMKTTSRLAGLNETFVRDMLRREKKPSIDAFGAIAGVLGVSIGHLVEGRDFTKGQSARRALVAQYVEAGVWSDSPLWLPDDCYEVAIPNDPELVQFKVQGAEVRGPSMDKIYPEGTVLIFTSQIDTRDSLVPGKRYIVEREKPDGDRESTVKTLARDGEGNYWLVPESHDPRFVPFKIEGSEGETIRIVGRVRYSVFKE